MAGGKIEGDSIDCLSGLYQFQPSVVLAAVFAALFGITTIIHTIQMRITRSWFLSVLVLGGYCEVIGYIVRIFSAQEPEHCKSLSLFLVQTVLILCSPALTAASIYMILGRIIRLVEGGHHSPIPLKWLTWIFVTGDFLSLNVQGAGGGLQNNPELTKILVVTGLFIQLFFFGGFVVVSGIFHHRNHKNPTPLSHEPTIRWQRHLITLYVTSALIFIRSVFRTIEYLQGYDGELMTKEFYNYVFDSALILFCMAWMNWFHPSEIGLMLRGEPTIKNGFDLLFNRRYPGLVVKEEQANPESSVLAYLDPRKRDYERLRADDAPLVSPRPNV